MISVNGINKAFDGYKVLRGVSFSVAEGEIYGLIGKNGAGKTTLLNILSGLWKADDGDYSYGVNYNKESIKIGYLPDLPSFFEYLTAGEYLDFLLMNKNKERRNELLDMVELSEKKKISGMSRGMKQRLGIAAAMVNDPEILLMDEPTSALDPSGRADVMRVLEQLKDRGKSILLSTHILTDMERVCDKVGFLSEGIIKKSLDIKELNNQNEYIQVSFGGKIVDDQILEQFKLKYDLLEDNVYRIEMGNEVETQNRLFEALAKINLPVSYIHNEVGTLDKLFQEVCE